MICNCKTKKAINQGKSSGSATALVGQEDSIVVKEKEYKNKGKGNKAFKEDDMTLSNLFGIRGNTLVKNSSSEVVSKNVVDSSSLHDSSTPLLETISHALQTEIVSITPPKIQQTETLPTNTIKA